MTRYVKSLGMVFCGLWVATCAAPIPERPDRPSSPPVETGPGQLGKADGFDWGSGCDGGSGTFSQPIAKDAVVTVGTIPKEMQNVEIKLTSPEDVDIQLYDADGTKIVQWPDGILSDAGEQSTTYKGVKVTWSGYNGDGTNLGHEYIKLEGLTQNGFVMKAYGYAAGQARVDYSWDAKPNCVDSGSGSFTQQIAKDAIVDVGKIPSGKSDIKIQLTSTVDIDIQLYDADGTKVVHWPDGKLNGAGKQSTTYKGVTVTWSGYNGDGTGKGNEYIELEGKTQNDFMMKVYGYEAGTAKVDYSWGKPASTASAMVIFSPTAKDKSHVAEALKLINGAKRSIDIAMYSMSDSRVLSALADAVKAPRNVKVRFIYHGAQEDRKSPAGTTSADYEDKGIDVRYATKSKVMHHKFMIVDGPRADDTGKVDYEAAKSATLVTGSGNWSGGAQTIYDENTVFISGVPELALRYQEEFNRLWSYSWDFTWKSFTYTPAATLDMSKMTDDPAVHALFTSANFQKNQSFTVKKGSYAVASAIVKELEQAKSSIRVASGHLRSWDVYDALVRLKQSKPALDIKVYLDGQEFISSYYDNTQEQDLQTCLSAAGSDTAAQLDCRRSGMYYSYRLHQAGVPLRFKYYCYRWDYHYAKQMHHKYIIIDDETLLTGSYNLSDNAEQGTLENVVVLKGSAYAGLVKQYSDNFDEMWGTDDDGSLLAALKNKVTSASTIPLVFEPMALTWDKVDELRSLIQNNCSSLFDADYKANPQKHTTCPRNP